MSYVFSRESRIVVDVCEEATCQHKVELNGQDLGLLDRSTIANMLTKHGYEVPTHFSDQVMRHPFALCKSYPCPYARPGKDHCVDCLCWSPEDVHPPEHKISVGPKDMTYVYANSTITIEVGSLCVETMPCKHVIHVNDIRRGYMFLPDIHALLAKHGFKAPRHVDPNEPLAQT
jgi:hypothetical protein